MSSIKNTSKSSIRRHALPENAVVECSKCRALARPKELADPGQTCPKCGASNWVVHKPDTARS